MLMGVSKRLGFPKVDPRKQFRQRLKVALKELALRGSKSSVWAQRRDALESLAYVTKNEKEFKANGIAVCACHQIVSALQLCLAARHHTRSVHSLFADTI